MTESDAPRPNDSHSAPTEPVCGKEWREGAHDLLWRCIRPPHPEHPDTHHYRVTAE